MADSGTPTPAAWERQDGEPALWWERFTTYLNDGSQRSLTEQVNRWRVSKGKRRSVSPTGSWRRAAEKWRWVERATAFDEAEITRKEAEAVRLKAERDAAEKQVIETARAARKQALAKINGLLQDTIDMYAAVVAKVKAQNPDSTGGVPVKELVGLVTAMQKLNDDSRAEFGDLPVTKIAPTTPDGKAAWQPFTADDLAAAKRDAEEHDRELLGGRTTDADNL